MQSEGVRGRKKRVLFEILANKKISEDDKVSLSLVRYKKMTKKTMFIKD